MIKALTLAVCGLLLLAGCAANHGSGVAATSPVPTPNPDAPRSISAADLSAAASAIAAAHEQPMETVTVTRTVTRTRTVTAQPKPKGPVTSGFTYKITASSGSATDVTYTEGGSIEQATGVSLPWSKTVRACGVLCEVSAQNAGSGKITCEIFTPTGKRVSRHSSSGAYATASCQY